MRPTPYEIKRQRREKSGIVQPFSRLRYGRWAYEGFRHDLLIPPSMNEHNVLRLLLFYVRDRRGWLREIIQHHMPKIEECFRSAVIDGTPAGVARFEFQPLREFFGFPTYLRDDACANAILTILQQILPAILDDALQYVGDHLRNRSRFHTAPEIALIESEKHHAQPLKSETAHAA